MLDLTKDQRTIKRQRERIEELEETIRQMKEEAQRPTTILIPASQFPSEWKLTKAHEKLLSALYSAADAGVPTERLSELVYVHKTPKTGERADNLLRVQILRMRKMLAPFGIEIHAHWGHGYVLPSASRRIVKEALDRRAAQ